MGYNLTSRVESAVMSRPATRSGVTASEVGTTASKLQRMQLTSFYVRPGFGKEGKPVEVLSNFFQVRARGERAKIIQ